jgi:tetratricopeptide (TPR) repeat protein
MCLKVTEIFRRIPPRMAGFARLRYWRGIWLLSLVGLLPGQVTQTQPAPLTAPAETGAKSDSERQRAIELFNAGNFDDAMPLFEKLAADHPEDATIKANLAFSIAAHAATLPDFELRKKARVRARAVALQAQNQGEHSATVQGLLLIPVDGSETAFSDRKEVDDAMKAAEADFARGDLDKARIGYLHALLLDPNNYYAALFIGDVYFKQHVNGSAGEWFARATEIDSNRETAYRYWGDAILAMGKISEAREKYIDAIIAEPYEQASWGGIQQWAQRAKVSLNWVRLQDKAKIVATEKGPRITLDPSLHSEDPMFKPWMVYSGRRLQWPQGKFKQQFPNEAQYRHTLAEESDALHLMVLALSLPGVSITDPSLAAVVRIDKAGFIEPFALLNRADKGVAQDYAAYRAAHRETIYRYFDEFVVPKAPQ